MVCQQDNRVHNHAPARLKFHAECDVAALVYGATDDPDAVLEAFACDLRRRGVDAIGLVQHRKDKRSEFQEPFDFVLVPDGELISTVGDVLSAGAQCGTRLRTVGKELSRALSRQPDVVVLNRFGWLEANGSGLLGVLEEAIERDIPVVIAVPEGLFARWLIVAQGLAVRLNCDRVSVDRWWQRLRCVPRTAGLNENFCERYK